jgi:NAD(P)-dependent dehydrogenase (short-subunit alcohol dehydrogenase family)
VDILCNNAGVSLRPFRAIWNYSYEDWKFMIDVNLWGVIHGMHVFIPRMRAQPGDKHIVNTSSEGVLMNMRGHCGYIAAKAGVCTLSEAAAKELADERIGMTVLLPGSTATSIATSERLRPAAERSEARQLPEYETPEIAHYLADRSYRRDPDDVGRLVLEAIEANQLLLLTHPAPQEVTTRTNSLLAGPGIVGSVSGDAGTEASVRGSVSA